MTKFRLSLFIAIMLSVVQVNASEAWMDMANTFAECAGVYQAASELMKDSGKEATAAVIRNVSNGARMSAAYILSLDRNQSIGDLLPYVDARSETERMSYLALVEMNDVGGISAKIENCASFADLQEQIIQQMREEIYFGGD